ncbi:MAG: hypothetical protein QF898_01475 [SAR202 cluster bacterium]|jgi:hypothetical protein|nr:hypothetical protein [SAR202 cluster bacterium]MDP6514924.1 hypothetical protein [SAR202 cluster bacterium]MDP6714566.1 hypothetical protein [SAR202 cluster bacterium]
MNMESKSPMAQTGIHVVQLPVQVSSEIDSFVDDFVSGNNNNVLRYAGRRVGAESQADLIVSQKRWQGADLWVISADLQAPEFSIVTRRVTIGAFSDAPDMMVFVPDIIVTTTNGKFMLPPDTPDWVDIEHLHVSVSELVQRFGVGSSSRKDVSHILSKVCSVAWRIAEEISPFEAHVLVA